MAGSWRGAAVRIAGIWIIAAVVLLLSLMYYFYAPGYFVLLPYPATVRGAVGLLGAVWRGWPVLAVEVVAIPILSLGLTVYWILTTARS